MTVLKPKNIYYMLSYAYRVLSEGVYKDTGSENFANIHNLFAEIIRLGVISQIKRGLNREYEETTDTIKTLRGRIDPLRSAPALSGASDKITCTFDEYTVNSPMNKVLKTTMNLLIKTEDVERERKNQLKSLLKYFSEADTLDPHTINWQTFQYHRNNATYKMLMNLCQFILSGMLITDEAGNHKIKEFIDDQQMHALYERFILEYYKKHHPEFSPAKEVISWNIDKNAFNEGLDFLPQMETDVTLHYKDRVLIIDAKYYTKELAASYLSDKVKFRTNNLFQIHTYVDNMDKNDDGSVDGMLLYAKTDEEGTPEMKMPLKRGNTIYIRTLDLSGEWNDISGALEQIANELKEKCEIKV